jgi:hypothetical protein
MPSPFPGMDPFLEGQEWRDFHHSLIDEIRTMLNPSVLPRYVVRVEEEVFLVPSPDNGANARRADWIVPDTFFVRGEGGSPRSSGGTATRAGIEPVTLTFPALAERRQAFLEIRYRETMDVVTVIELFSPTNKDSRGAGHSQYLRKREKVLSSPAHLVELDLLRGGERLQTVEPLPSGAYYAFVSRVSQRPEVAVYAWPLPHLLPVIPIPLAGEDPDVFLDLQTAFTTVYDRAAYPYTLDYRRPVEPPLSDADAAWVQEMLAGAQIL